MTFHVDYSELKDILVRLKDIKRTEVVRKVDHKVDKVFQKEIDAKGTFKHIKSGIQLIRFLAQNKLHMKDAFVEYKIRRPFVGRKYVRIKIHFLWGLTNPSRSFQDTITLDTYETDIIAYISSLSEHTDLQKHLA